MYVHVHTHHTCTRVEATRRHGRVLKMTQSNILQQFHSSRAHQSLQLLHSMLGVWHDMGVN